MQAVKKVLDKLANRPRLRVLIIVVGLVIVFIIGMNLFSSGDSNYGKPVAPPSRITPVHSDNTQPVAPVQQKTYENLANRVETAQTTEQIQTGRTLFSNVFGNSQTTKAPGSASSAGNSSDTTDIVSPQEAEKDSRQPLKTTDNPAPPSPQVKSMAAAASNYAASSYNTPPAVSQQQTYLAQQQQQQAQQQQQQISQLQQSMSSAIQSIQSSWAMPKSTTVSGVSGSSSGNLGPGGNAPDNTPVAIKAGTIMFAVMDTALDSDQPGTPVMATIVAGPYTGAMLMGTFTREGEKLVVQFTQMSIKSQPATISIGTAYAIDSKTANNAVASSVDNHYLLRYGMLFAASFLQGFGSAYQNYTYTCPPNTQSCTVINSTGTPNTTATTKTAMYQGFGQVGTNLGQVAAAQFNTPPTVTLDQGTGIGILFMNDVKIPQV